MTQTTSTLTKKVLIGAGVTAAATVGALYATANLLFSFALDTQARRSMMRRLQDGELEDPQPETPAADMAEQEEAADWFEESKQPISMMSHDGFKLHGWLVDPDCVSPTPHLYAICCHGYSGDPAEMAKYAHRYARMGFTVLVPASRGHELSQGRYIGMGWLERVDLMDWIGVITAADPQARILLHGNSMGGAAVMMAAGEASLPRNVVAAIEDSGFTSVWDQFMFNARSLYHLPRWAARPLVATMSLICRHRAGYGFREASCVRQLHHTTIPMLFIHGGADDFVSPASLERNFDACASIDRQKMMIPGAGHTMAASTDPERYWRRVTHFVTRTFGL